MSTVAGPKPEHDGPSACSAGAVPAADSGAQDPPGFAEGSIAATRAVIDIVDSCIIALVERRTSLSHEIQQFRLKRDEPRLSVSRELEIVERYRSVLGKNGSDLSRVILAISRGAGPDRT